MEKDIEERYPEHTKLGKIKDKSQAIGEFMDWLTNENGIVLAKYDSEISDYLPSQVHFSIRNLLAVYFKIDQDKLEKEKLEMLEEQRKLNSQSNEPTTTN